MDEHGYDHSGNDDPTATGKGSSACVDADGAARRMVQPQPIPDPHETTEDILTFLPEKRHATFRETLDRIGTDDAQDVFDSDYACNPPFVMIMPWNLGDLSYTTCDPASALDPRSASERRWAVLQVVSRQIKVQLKALEREPGVILTAAEDQQRHDLTE
jgi:hypothetical protein